MHVATIKKYENLDNPQNRLLFDQSTEQLKLYSDQKNIHFIHEKEKR
jgi:hypothetical protein